MRYLRSEVHWIIWTLSTESLIAELTKELLWEKVNAISSWKEINLCSLKVFLDAARCTLICLLVKLREKKEMHRQWKKEGVVWEENGMLSRCAEMGWRKPRHRWNWTGEDVKNNKNWFYSYIGQKTRPRRESDKWEVRTGNNRHEEVWDTQQVICLSLHWLSDFPHSPNL